MCEIVMDSRHGRRFNHLRIALPHAAPAVAAAIDRYEITRLTKRAPAIEELFDGLCIVSASSCGDRLPHSGRSRPTAPGRSEPLDPWRSALS